MYATYDYTTYAEVLSGAKKKLGLENTTSEDFYLRLLMIEAVGEIPSLELTEYKSCTLEICDFKAKLPCGFIRISQPNGIRFRNGERNWIPETNDSVVFNNTNTNTSIYQICNGVQFNAGYLIFSSNTNVAEVDIYGLFVLVDDQGRPKIPKSHARTIQYYMMGMYGQTNPGKYPFASDWMDRWGRGKRMLKGKSNVPNVNQKEQIFINWNTLL